mgnify:CR=1 FL=1
MVGDDGTERAGGDPDPKAVYPRFAAAINRRDLDALDDLIAPDIVNHGAAPDDPPGAARFKRAFRALIAACPDFRIDVEQQIAEGDWVAVRWTDRGTDTGGFWGRPPTHRPIVLTGIDVIRVRRGRIVERWGEYDLLSVLQTLGIVAERLAEPPEGADAGARPS